MNPWNEMTLDLLLNHHRKIEEVCRMALDHYGCQPHELEVAVHPDGSYYILGPRPCFAVLDGNGDRIS